MSVPNYYEILGVPINADPAAIQRAMTKYAQTAKTDDDLHILQACKTRLLDAAAREQYNRELLLANPDLVNAALQQMQAVEETPPPSVRRQREAEPPPEPPAVRPFFKFLIGIPTVLIIFSILFVKPKPATKALDEFSAQVACENTITDILKAPSTADFGGWERTPNGDGTYTVTGHVDAQNSFGAKIRNRFSCHVRDNHNGTHTTTIQYLR